MALGSGRRPGGPCVLSVPCCIQRLLRKACDSISIPSSSWSFVQPLGPSGPRCPVGRTDGQGGLVSPTLWDPPLVTPGKLWDGEEVPSELTGSLRGQKEGRRKPSSGQRPKRNTVGTGLRMSHPTASPILPPQWGTGGSCPAVCQPLQRQDRGQQGFPGIRGTPLLSGLHSGGGGG